MTVNAVGALISSLTEVFLFVVGEISYLVCEAAYQKERANNFEHHIEDLTKQLRDSTCQYEKLTSDNEDLLARIETLQANARLLEAQILEVQRAKGVVEKELEAEKLQKEQKIKEHVSTTNELEELQLQFQKEKKQLQKTMQELELVKKDAQQTTLMNMEIADYERLILN